MKKYILAFAITMSAAQNPAHAGWFSNQYVQTGLIAAGACLFNTGMYAAHRWLNKPEVAKHPVPQFLGKALVYTGSWLSGMMSWIATNRVWSNKIPEDVIPDARVVRDYISSSVTAIVSLASVYQVSATMRTLKPETDTRTLGAFETPDISHWNNYIGDQPEAIKQIINQLDDSERYEKLQAELPTGYIFYGPPGTGKTALARAIAARAGCPFLAVDTKQMVSKWVGDSAKHVGAIFDAARTAARASAKKCAIIFFDEIDGDIKSRNGPMAHPHDSSLTSALLKELDGFKKYPDVKIICIGTTNRIDSLDEALTRSERMGDAIEIGLPSEAVRAQLIAHYCRAVCALDEKDLETLSKKLAQKTSNWSPADIKATASQARRSAAYAHSKALTAEHIENAFNARIDVQRAQEEERQQAEVARKIHTVARFQQVWPSLGRATIDEYDRALRRRDTQGASSSAVAAAASAGAPVATFPERSEIE